MGLLDFWKEGVAFRHGVRAAQEWVEQNGGSDEDVSDGTLESLAEATNSPDAASFAEGFDFVMEREADKEEARERGGWKAFLFG